MGRADGRVCPMGSQDLGVLSVGRPVDLGGGYSIAVTPLGRKLASALAEHGEFYFGPRELFDAFGLGFTTQETQEAIQALLAFQAELQSFGCKLQAIGFVELERGKTYALEYTVISTKHENQPLVVREAFSLETPLLVLVNSVAGMWVSAFAKRPISHIQAVALGG